MLVAAAALQHDVLHVIYLLTNMSTSCCHEMCICSQRRQTCVPADRVQHLSTASCFSALTKNLCHDV